MIYLKNELAAAYERIDYLYKLVEHYKQSEKQIIENYKASLVREGCHSITHKYDNE